MQNTYNDLENNLSATPLRNNVWAIRPMDQLGTCGSYPALWTVTYVKAYYGSVAIDIYLAQGGKSYS